MYHLATDHHARVQWNYFGPRRNGRPRSRAGLVVGVLLLLVLSLAFGLGSIWNRLLEGFAGR